MTTPDSDRSSGHIPATRLDREPNFDLRFPPLTRTVVDVSNLLAEQSDVPEIERLVELVDADPVVAAAVLRRVNSAFYGLRRQIGDIKKAVHLLGFEEVCDLVITAGMMKLRDVLSSAEQVDIFEQLMLLSVGAARYCKTISHQLELTHWPAAFTAGLLHPVGRLVLLYNRPNDYEALWFTNESGLAPSAISEQVIFGTDHAQLGAMAAEQWHLPELLVRVLRLYITPGHLDDPQLRMLALAVSTSVTAAEALYAVPKGAPPAAFRPPAALFQLARGTDTPPEEIVAAIEREGEQIRLYAQSMVKV